MQPALSMAFKDWAVICAALESGRQTLIVRKGGIHEGQAGFRVAHREFWLFPTYMHEAAGGLVEDAAPLIRQVEAHRPPAGELRLSVAAAVTDVFELADETVLAGLSGMHLWSHRTLSERFHYCRPGLFVLIVRVYRTMPAIVLPDSPHFAGCRSWVELPTAVPTAHLAPVLADTEFTCRRLAIQAALIGARSA